MIDNTGHLMTKAEMLEKSKTERGRRDIAEGIETSDVDCVGRA